MKPSQLVILPFSQKLVLSQSFADSVPNGLIVTDLSLRILQVNRWISQRLNIHLEDILGMPIDLAFPELSQRNLIEAYHLVIQTSMPLTLANRIHRFLIKMPPSSSYSGMFTEMPQSVIISPLFEDNQMAGTLTTIFDVTERVMTERALQNEVLKLNALQSISRALSTLDIDKCLQTIVENSTSLFEAQVSSLFLNDQDGLTIACQIPEGQPVKPNLTLFQSITENMKSMAISSNQYSDHQDQENKNSTEMAAPLIVENRCIGILDVCSRTHLEYRQDDLRLLDILASRAAIAIHNARLHRKERAQRQLLESLNEISITLTSDLNPDSVLDSLLVSIEHVLPYDTARVLLVDGDKLKIVRQRGFQADEGDHFLGTSQKSLDDIPFLHQMASRRSPLIIADTQVEPTWIPLEDFNQVRSSAGVPIFIRGALIGFLLLEKKEPNFYSEEYSNILAAFSAQASIALENARLFEQQKLLAMIDGLTGLTNRRAFDEILTLEMERSQRYNHPTSLIMIDIDFFKRYNDTYGHLVGDAVLKNMALLFQRNLRRIDTVARFGGEEFVIILPETNTKDALISANRLLEKVARMHIELPLPFSRLPDQQVTVSMGISTAPLFAQNPMELIMTADQALYMAKKSGRNRVCVFCNLA